MNWLLRVKGKRYKICAIFVMIIALVLLQNVLERRHISNLDHSVAAIYKDRLLPATYLYGISNHLHQQRLLAADATYPRAAHDAAITNLIKEYELTHLTPEEKKQWAAFKQQWQAYRVADTDASFLTTLQTLNSLNDIQVAEGKILQRHSASIASESTLTSQLEITLLIVLGMLAIILLLISDQPLIFKEQQPTVLN